MSDNTMNNKKLSKKSFIYGMEYLNAYYTLLKIDLDSEVVQKVWYDVFQNFSDEVFQGIVKGYCVSNIYPPQSPTHLLEYGKTIALRGELSGDEAWELGYSLVKSNRFDVKSACKEMEEKGYHAMANAFLKMGGVFKGITTDDLKWVKRDWKEKYEDELKGDIQEKIIGGTIAIGVGIDNKKLLETNDKEVSKNGNR